MRKALTNLALTRPTFSCRIWRCSDVSTCCRNWTSTRTFEAVQVMLSQWTCKRIRAHDHERVLRKLSATETKDTWTSAGAATPQWKAQERKGSEQRCSTFLAAPAPLVL